MSLPIDKENFAEEDYRRFSERLDDNLAALRALLQRPGFGAGPASIGAELELSLIDQAGEALHLNRRLLAETLDPQLALELNRFNLEYNLTPVPAAGSPFTAMENELADALASLEKAASAHGGRVVAIGILPTLKRSDLETPAMTDLPRYRAISAGVRRLRREPFSVWIDGENPLRDSFDDVTLEGANTSFQIHLRVEPDDFISTYNAIQLATPLVLALSANSPVFLGHRLWDETRVALFRQAVDDRGPQASRWHQPERVSFGYGWARRSPIELFEESVALFPPLLPAFGDEDYDACLLEGGLPALAELRLQQSTVWRWNRGIYDPGCGGHLRIEMRTLPAGPSPVDMAASAAFLIGLGVGLRAGIDSLISAFPFRYAEYNFYRAAREGMGARLLWPCEGPPSPKEVDVAELAQRLLPVAADGLAQIGVEEAEVERMLGVIEGRIAKRRTGADWQRQVLADLGSSGLESAEAMRVMLEMYLREGGTGRPVAEWSTRR